MASFTWYEDATLQMWSGVHNFLAAGNVLKVALHSDAPTLTTDDEMADLTQPTGTGYTALGIDTANDISEAAGVTTLVCSDQTWTATAGDWTAARYVVVHNDTSTTDKLLFDWDYGGNFTLANGETFTVDFGASTATLDGP